MRTSSHSTYRITQVTLWFGFLGSAIAWFLHLMIVYLIAEAVCIAGLPNFEMLGVPGTTILLVLITTAAVALCAASGIAAYRNQTKLDEQHATAASEVSRGASRHMARGGVYLSIFFIFTIVMQLFPVFFMHPCP